MFLQPKRFLQRRDDRDIQAVRAEEIARGIYALARDWTLDRSGDFYKWNGEPHAW